jgi:L-iditol 2-dehydrogenase
MKAAQVIARGQVRIADVPVPTLRPGHVLVRSRILSLCGSDIRMLHFASDASYPFPLGTSGHEMIGQVEAVDAPNSSLQVGDYVLALAPDHRAMAEYFLAPIENVLPLPNGTSLELLLHGQQLGTVLFACQHLPQITGKTVAVIGQGSAGLFFNFRLREMGARRIIAIDLDAWRLDNSKSFGATQTLRNTGEDIIDEFRNINDGQLADVVVEAAGEIAAINLAIDLVRHGGDILFFGYPRGQSISFKFEEFFHKCCRAKAIVGASVEANHQSTRRAIELIHSGRIDVSKLTTHRIPFARLSDAYEMHRSRADHCVKILIEMPDQAQ